MRKYEELLSRNKELKEDDERIFKNMDSIIQENKRVEEFAKNTSKNLKEIEKIFEKQTGLSSLDNKLLFLATALQCVRQYILTNDKLRFNNDQQASKVIKKFAPISLTGPVPYDAFKKDGFKENTGISGRNHRYTTLGHDPILGWIFGTINILSETVTKNNLFLSTYNTNMIGNEYKISDKSSIIIALNSSIDRVKSDYKTLPLAVMKHAVHLSSDVFTTMGLPIPIINQVSPNLSSKLLKNGIDIYSVGRGFTISSLINMIIATIHGLFYNQNLGISKEIYEVRTKKILIYSNFISSQSNIVYSLLSRDLKKLDVGGIIQTIHRFVTDRNFILNIKAEFVYNEFSNRIQESKFNLEL